MRNDQRLINYRSTTTNTNFPDYILNNFWAKIYKFLKLWWHRMKQILRIKLKLSMARHIANANKSMLIVASKSPQRTCRQQKLVICA